MKKILIFGCLTIVILVITAGVFIGFKVSQIISGAGKPKNLGLSATMEQAKRAQEKTQVEVISLPADTSVSSSIRFEGSHPMTFELDSSELTALALSHGQYKYFPFSSIQIKINTDNTVEISCVADTMKAFSYATAIGFASADLEKVMIDYKIPRSSIPIYAKGSGSVSNGKVTLNLTSGEVAGIRGWIEKHTRACDEIAHIFRRQSTFQRKCSREKIYCRVRSVIFLTSLAQTGQRLICCEGIFGYGLSFQIV
jgi:hypothetical protein